jgi:hypothetical protein
MRARTCAVRRARTVHPHHPPATATSSTAQPELAAEIKILVQKLYSAACAALRVAAATSLEVERTCAATVSPGARTGSLLLLSLPLTLR